MCGVEGAPLPRAMLGKVGFSLRYICGQNSEAAKSEQGDSYENSFFFFNSGREPMKSTLTECLFSVRYWGHRNDTEVTLFCSRLEGHYILSGPVYLEL